MATCTAHSSRFPWFAEAFTHAVPTARPGDVGCAVGHAFCVEPPGGQGPAIVVVASTIDRGFGTLTRKRLTRDDCAQLAVRGALTVAHEYLKKLPPGRRRLVALPALRMGLGGDRNDSLRSARTQVRAAHDCLRDLPGVDVAFISFTPDKHPIFLQARRDVLGGPPPARCPRAAGRTDSPGSSTRFGPGGACCSSARACPGSCPAGPACSTPLRPSWAGRRYPPSTSKPPSTSRRTTSGSAAGAAWRPRSGRATPP